MALTLITAPVLEPVSLEEARAHLRIDGEYEDLTIRGMLRAALAELDGHHGWLGRAILTQTWKFTIDAFPCGAIRLPLPPLQSVTSVKYLDGAGVEQTLSSALYTVFTGPEPGFVEPVYGGTWPVTRGITEAVRITYVAGWASAAAIPEPIKLYLKMRAGTLYATRETVGALKEDAPWARFMLENYRIRALCP